MIAPTARRVLQQGFLVSGLLLVPAIAAFAQSPPGATPPAGAAAKARPAATGSTQAAAKSTGKAEAQSADAPQLRQRIEQLEEQLTEMHVAVGTLESLAKSGAARAVSSAPPVGGGALSGDGVQRIEGLEGRLRQLSMQVEQLSQQMRAMESRGGGRFQERGEGPPAMQPPATRAAEAVEHAREPGGQRSDAIGTLIRGPGSDRSADVGAAPLPPVGGEPDAPRRQPASLTTGNPRELYERAYGSLLKQDYPGAEAGFAEFLQQNPEHDLAGNAQYWLGESNYVRGRYREAANAFLKGYQSYPRSQKAPDSLLKLGMSLERLGQKEAACSTIGELATRFPTAPAHIQSRAKSERARLGC